MLAAARQRDPCGFGVAPLGPGGEAGRELGDGVADVAPEQRGKRVDEVDVDFGPYAELGARLHHLAEGAPRVHDRLTAARYGGAVLVVLKHGLPHRRNVPVEQPLGDNAPPELAHADGPGRG